MLGYYSKLSGVFCFYFCFCFCFVFVFVFLWMSSLVWKKTLGNLMMMIGYRRIRFSCKIFIDKNTFFFHSLITCTWSWWGRESIKRQKYFKIMSILIMIEFVYMFELVNVSHSNKCHSGDLCRTSLDLNKLPKLGFRSLYDLLSQNEHKVETVTLSNCDRFKTFITSSDFL